MKSKIKSILVFLLVVFLFFSFITLSIKADNTGSLFTQGGTDVNALIGAKDVWQMKDAKGNPIDGTGMVVAVIDTGVDYTHPDLGGGFGQNYKVIGGYDFRDKDSDPMDTDGHGTEDAGVIAANGKVVGVAPNAKILAYRTNGNFPNASPIFPQAVKDGANVIIVDQYMSYYPLSYKTGVIDSLINSITNKGVSFVGPAGNYGTNFIGFTGPNRTLSFPSLPQAQVYTASGAITVAAYDVDQKTMAEYSSIGPSPDLIFKPDIMAPTNIYTTRLNGTYDSNFNGTSASTPVISGCVTLVKQAHPDWTTEEIKASLMNNATVEYNPQNNEPITWLLQGAGLVNVYKAVTTPALITPYSTLMTPDNLKPIIFTIKNVSDTTQTFSISSELTLGNFAYGNTDGVSVSLSDNQVTLNKGETKTVTATITVDKSKLEAGPYEGLVWFDNGSTKLHVPFIIWNAGAPITWNQNLPKIFDVKTSTNVLDFSDPNNNKITFDFTLGKGSVHKSGGGISSYYSDTTDKVEVSITDMNGNLVSTVYSNNDILLGHYKFEWSPSVKTLQNLVSNGFKDGEYKYVISAVDNDTTDGRTQTVSGTFEVKNTPHIPNLSIDVQDGLVVSGDNPVFRLTGKTDPGCTVEIYGGQKLDVNDDGSFTAEIKLKSGNNYFIVISKNQYGFQYSIERNVVFEPILPKLSINIQDNLTITKYSTDTDMTYTFTGKTDPGCIVTVNDNTATVDSNGNFTAKVPLNSGWNTIVVTSANLHGLSTTINRNVYLQIELATVIKLIIGSSKFTVNDETRILDSPPIIKNGRTLLPIRAVVEALGGTVDWSPSDKKATVSLGTNTIELWIGKPQAKVNGTSKWIDDTNHKVVPEIINGRTMIPLRFVAENLGATVDWNQDTKTVTITYEG